MYSNDFKLTSSAVILAALLLAATDTKAGNTSENSGFRLKTDAKSFGKAGLGNPNEHAPIIAPLARSRL